MDEQTGISLVIMRKVNVMGTSKVHDHVNDERVRRVGGQYDLHWLAL